VCNKSDPRAGVYSLGGERVVNTSVCSCFLLYLFDTYLFVSVVPFGYLML
jgi:hypothetical protein